MTFSFRHSPLQSSQEPIIIIQRIINAVEIPKEGAE
jgi:hypothetical protein